MTTLCTFIIPLRPASTAHDWAMVSELCCQTIKSCLQNSNFRTNAIVIGHDKPLGFESLSEFFGTRLSFIDAESPPPSNSAGDAGMQDKWAKVAQGIVSLWNDMPEYFMILDADDLISKRLIDYLGQKRPPFGFIIKNGYYHRHESHFLYCYNGTFSCGSDSIISTNSVYMPSDTSRTETRKCTSLTAGHTVIADAMKEQGKPLEVVPFPAVIYLGYDGQHSTELSEANKGLPWGALRMKFGAIWQFMKFNGSVIFKSKRIVEEFGL